MASYAIVIIAMRREQLTAPGQDMGKDGSPSVIINPAAIASVVIASRKDGLHDPRHVS